MWVNNVRQARNLFHVIINKNCQDRLRHVFFLFWHKWHRGLKKKKGNFIALAKLLSREIWKLPSRAKNLGISMKHGYGRNMDLDLRLTYNRVQRRTTISSKKNQEELHLENSRGLVT